MIHGLPIHWLLSIMGFSRQVFGGTCITSPGIFHSPEGSLISVQADALSLRLLEADTKVLRLLRY